MGLFVLGSVGRVGELFGAVELVLVLAAERLLASVGADVYLAILGSGKCSVAPLELKKKKTTRN